MQARFALPSPVPRTAGGLVFPSTVNLHQPLAGAALGKGQG